VVVDEDSSPLGCYTFLCFK